MTRRQELERELGAEQPYAADVDVRKNLIDQYWFTAECYRLEGNEELAAKYAELSDLHRGNA